MKNNKTIFIASDHAGYELKKEIISYLHKNDYLVIDFGSGPEKSNYAEYAHLVAEKVVINEDCVGILICGSGVGMCITANKTRGVRAGICWDVEIAELMRLHNDANIICFPARFISIDGAIDSVNTFLFTQFEGGRHEDRVKTIEKI